MKLLILRLQLLLIICIYKLGGLKSYTMVYDSCYDPNSLVAVSCETKGKRTMLPVVLIGVLLGTLINLTVRLTVFIIKG